MLDGDRAYAAHILIYFTIAFVFSGTIINCLLQMQYYIHYS